MSCFIGIDLGTSSLKSLLVHESGHLLASAARDYQFDSPHPGYAEQDPEVWWRACVETVREILSVSGTNPREVKSVSFSGQMHGLVTLDKDLKPVRPAILHCDTRSGTQVNRLKEVFSESEIQNLMMNPIYTGFLLPSLLWMREAEPANFERVRHLCLPKDYLKVKMTGAVSSDHSDASATLAFDIPGLRWSQEIISRIGLPASLFPECHESTAAVGKVSRTAAEQMGLSEDTLVIAGGSDQTMQALGNGLVNPLDTTVNIGSAGQVSFQIDRPVLNPQLNTNMFCGCRRDRWILYGATMSAGLCLKWWNNVTGKRPYDELNREIASVPVGSGGLLFLPYLNGERTPHLNPNLRSLFAGINQNTTKAQMTRAVMEGVTFALYECMQICRELGFESKMLVASGGGARSPQWLQIQADIFNLPIRVAKIEEQASLGAAIVAATGAGIYRTLEEGCARIVRYQDQVVQPIGENHRTYSELFPLFQQAYRSNRELLESLTRFVRRK